MTHSRTLTLTLALLTTVGCFEVGVNPLGPGGADPTADTGTTAGSDGCEDGEDDDDWSGDGECEAIVEEAEEQLEDADIEPGLLFDLVMDEDWEGAMDLLDEAGIELEEESVDALLECVADELFADDDEDEEDDDDEDDDDGSDDDDCDEDEDEDEDDEDDEEDEDDEDED